MKNATIKNQARVNELMAKGWTWNQDQEFNPGQLDAPKGDGWYDAESDLFDGEVVCAHCSKVYDYEDEPAEVKEGGIHICSSCWQE